MRSLIPAALLLVGPSVLGQGDLGTVLLLNRAGTFDAPVFYSFGDVSGRADERFLAQLYAGPIGGTLVPTGEPLPFRSGAGIGYIDPTGVDNSRTIAGVAAGGQAQAMITAWPSAMGSTYAEAKALGILGESAVLNLGTGGGLNPPKLLVGLSSFTITASDPQMVLSAMAAQAAGSSVPEPGATLVFALGGLLLFAGTARGAKV